MSTDPEAITIPTDPECMEGPCVAGCGRHVRRPVAVGKYALLVNSRPLWCDECIAAQEESDRHEESDRQRRELDQKFSRLLSASGMPVVHHSRTLADLAASCPPGVMAAERWVDGGSGLLLTGPVGVGKTTLAGAAALEMLRQGRRLLWTSAPLLFARLGSGFDSASRQWALDVLAGADPLVLDDIDKARPTEYAAEQLFLAVDQRVEHLIPLLVTANLSLEELAGRWPSPYGEAIASRLYGYCATVHMTGSDRRGVTA